MHQKTVIFEFSKFTLDNKMANNQIFQLLTKILLEQNWDLSGMLTTGIDCYFLKTLRYCMAAQYLQAPVVSQFSPTAPLTTQNLYTKIIVKVDFTDSSGWKKLYTKHEGREIGDSYDMLRFLEKFLLDKKESLDQFLASELHCKFNDGDFFVVGTRCIE